MQLKTKVFTLVGLSALSLVGATASFTFLESTRQQDERHIRELDIRLERARDLEMAFSDFSGNALAAVVSHLAGEIAMTLDQGKSLQISASLLAPSRELTVFLEALREYLNILESLSEGNKNMTTAAAVGLLQKKEMAAQGALDYLKTQVASSLEAYRAHSQRHWRRYQSLIYSILGAFLLSLCLLAIFWISDLRRAFGAIDRALIGLAQGGLPYVEPKDMARQDEIGSLLRALARVAQEAKNLQQTMMRWDRLASMGQLAGGVAHEINNPLVGVLGQAEVLMNKLPREDPNRALVEKIFTAAQRCRKIVRNLLDFSRQRDYELKEASLEEVLDSAMDMVSTDLERSGIEVERHLSQPLPKIQAHPMDLTEVFLNLILNAKDAMPKGGRLMLRTRVQACKGASGKEEKEIGIEIEDTGMGIAPEVLPRIFEAFYTTKELGKGTGLGLSVSYGIIKNHGGQMIAASPGIGKGAKFTILLPVKNSNG